MSVRQENRWRNRLQKENDARDQLRGELEALGRTSTPRNPPPKPAPLPTKAKIRNWMIANAPEYEGATQLAEGANAEFDLPESWLDSETHWIWDLAADCYMDED